MSRVSRRRFLKFMGGVAGRLLLPSVVPVPQASISSLRERRERAALFKEALRRGSFPMLDNFGISAGRVREIGEGILSHYTVPNPFGATENEWRDYHAIRHLAFIQAAIIAADESGVFPLELTS